MAERIGLEQLGAEPSAMLGHLSHELRSPLGVLLGSLRLLEKRATGLSPADLRALGAALRASSRALELVDEVSSLARLVEGRQPLVSTLVSVAQLVTDATAPMAHGQNELPPVLLDFGPDGDATVRVDVPRMHAAIRTLLIATARSRPDARAVTVRAAVRAARRRPEVTITISPDDTEAQRLTRFDWARGGHGLQLALAAATVVLHGGQLRSRRDGRRDAGVCVLLPADAASAPAAKPSRRVRRSATREGGSSPATRGSKGGPLSSSPVRADEGRTRPSQRASDARRDPGHHPSAQTTRAGDPGGMVPLASAPPDASR